MRRDEKHSHMKSHFRRNRLVYCVCYWDKLLNNKARTYKAAQKTTSSGSFEINAWWLWDYSCLPFANFRTKHQEFMVISSSYATVDLKAKYYKEIIFINKEVTLLEGSSLNRECVQAVYRRQLRPSASYSGQRGIMCRSWHELLKPSLSLWSHIQWEWITQSHLQY